MSEEELLDLVVACGGENVRYGRFDDDVIEFNLESLKQFVEEIRLREAKTLGHL